MGEKNHRFRSQSVASLKQAFILIINNFYAIIGISNAWYVYDLLDDFEHTIGYERMLQPIC